MIVEEGGNCFSLWSVIIWLLLTLFSQWRVFILISLKKKKNKNINAQQKKTYQPSNIQTILEVMRLRLAYTVYQLLGMAREQMHFPASCFLHLHSNSPPNSPPDYFPAMVSKLLHLLFLLPKKRLYDKILFLRYFLMATSWLLQCNLLQGCLSLSLR